MANLHKFTVQEALNAGGVGGQWTINPVSIIHGGTTSTYTVHLDISGATQLGVYAAGDIYFRFGTAGTTGTTDDCIADDDLLIQANTLVFLTVPRGLGNTIYFNHLGVAATTVKTVEV